MVESVGPCLRRGTFCRCWQKVSRRRHPRPPKQNERRRHCLRRSWLTYSEYRSADHPARCRRDPLACHRGTVPRLSPPSAPAERTALPPHAPPARRALPSVPLLPAAGPARSPRTAPLRRAAAVLRLRLVRVRLVGRRRLVRGRDDADGIGRLLQLAQGLAAAASAPDQVPQQEQEQQKQHQRRRGHGIGAAPSSRQTAAQTARTGSPTARRAPRHPPARAGRVRRRPSGR